MSTKSLMQISFCGQELCGDNVPPPQIGLWQPHTLDMLFPFVHRVEEGSVG